MAVVRKTTVMARQATVIHNLTVMDTIATDTGLLNMATATATITMATVMATTIISTVPLPSTV